MNIHLSRWTGALFCFLVGAMALVTSSATAQKVDGKPKMTASAKAKLDPELELAIRNAPDASQWPNNNYATLLDLGTVRVESDGTVVARYRLTYKLFNERARDQLAEVNKEFNASYQTLRILKAQTIRKDGSVMPVKMDDIRVANPYSDFLMYDDAKSVGFSFPAVEEGCILDYTWEEVTKPLLMPGQFWTYWGFNGAEPSLLSRYSLTVPASKPLKYRVYNDETLTPKITDSKDGKSKTYVWERANMKPLEFEVNMPDVSDVRTWLEVSSLDSWQSVAKWFSGLQKPQMKATPTIQETVSKLIANKKTEEEKARAIYDWVANRTRYVGLEFGISAYRPHPAADVHDKLYGDCKDKANLLITMLGLAGIKANPVLLSAGERRPVAGGLPTLNRFNHCIAQANIGGKEFWLDATAETCAFGDVPTANRGVEALVVRDGVGEFETIPTYKAEETGTEAKLNISLRPDGTAIIQANLTMRGGPGQGIRSYARALTPDKRKEVMQGIAQAISVGGNLKEFTLPDGQQKDGAFTMTLTLEAPNYAKKAGSSLLLIPLFNGNDRQTNPYLKETRLWPIVEKDASQTRTETVVTLPEGYTLEDAPGDVALENAIHRYRRTVKKSPDGKSLTIQESIVERPGTIPAKEYPAVRAHYDALIKTYTDQIVLKKNK